MSDAPASLCGMRPENLPVSSRLAGVVTTRGLVAAGLTGPAIRTLVGRGVLMPLARGVYGRPGLVGGLKGLGERGERALRLAVALAVVGPPAVGSHQDAAIVHGLALLDRPPAGIVAVSRPPAASGSRTGRPGIRIHNVTLPADHVAMGGVIPLTSVARTVADLARTTSFRSGVVVTDSALHARKTTRDELHAVLRACARWPGISRARQVVAFSDARSESPFESISRVAFSEGGLPQPELQVWVGGFGRQIGRVDFLWREHRTIAEADGAAKYADPELARRQLRRDADLREAGFEVVHFSWAELTLTPDQVVRSIRAAFGRASALRAASRTSSGS